MSFVQVFHRRKWPVALPLYDGRACPWCGAIVHGKYGQDRHQRWHEQLEAMIGGGPDLDSGGRGGAVGAVEGVVVGPPPVVGYDAADAEGADGSGGSAGGVAGSEETWEG